MLSLRKSLILALVILLVTCYREDLCADEFRLIPSITATEEFNDNVFMVEDEEDEIDDYITTISPGLRLEKKTERLVANLLGWADILIYDENDDLDTVDQFYSGDFQYRLTPRTDISAAASYTRDSRRDRDIERTGLVILSNAERNRQHYTFSAGYDLSEKSSTELSYTYDQDDYDDEEFVDYWSHQAGLIFTRDIGDMFPQTNGRMNFGYARYDFTDTVVDKYTLSLGATHQLSEIFSLLVNIGASYNRSEFELSGVKSEDWRPTGEVSIRYGGEFTSSRLTLFRDIGAASSREGTSDRTALTFNIDRSFTEKFRLGLTAGYYLNEADQGELATEDIDERTFRIQPRIRYDLTKNLSIVTAYTYTLVDDKDEDLTRKRNLVFIRLLIQYPFFE